MRRYIKKVHTQDDININIVPLIDVLFSILVAFMIPTQSLFGNLDIQLPTADAEIVVLKKDPIKLFVDRNGSIIINKQEVKLKDLTKKINDISFRDKNIKIYILADKKNNYGKILDIFGKLNNNGFKDVVLITDLYNRL